VADHAGELDSLVELTAEPLKVVEQRREVGADRDEAGEVLGGFGGTASDRLRAASNPGAHLFLMGLEPRYEGGDAAIIETAKISDGRVVHLHQALQLLIIRHLRNGPLPSKRRSKPIRARSPVDELYPAGPSPRSSSGDWERGSSRVPRR
jgi:hypothetical protein